MDVVIDAHYLFQSLIAKIRQYTGEWIESAVDTIITFQSLIAKIRPIAAANIVKDYLDEMDSFNRS